MDDPHGCFVGAPVRQAGRAGGLVVAVKDNIDVAGLPTRAGLGGPGVIAAADAPVVRRLRMAGCTLLGKTRMDEAALGGNGNNPHHGRTENPRAPGHSPGGSSAGSAAAVAAGMCDAALGTDTLGSVRIPAAYCGVVGLKPTRGLLSTVGVAPLSRTLDHVGLLGGTVAAMARLLELFQAPAPLAASLRVCFLDDLPGVAPTTSASCRAAVRATDWIIDAGCIPEWDLPATRRAGLLVAEAEGAVVYAMLLAADPALSASVRRMLVYGRDCGSDRLVRALDVLRRTAAGLDQVLDRYDLIALPTVAAPAFAWGDGPPSGQADLTGLVNAGGQPAISIPVGLDPIGRPIGLQLIGRRGADWTVVHAANQITQFLRNPAIAAVS